MNKYILDTQVILWWFAGHKRLSKNHRNIIDKPGNNIYVSAISLFELYIKVDIGKLLLPDDFNQVIVKADFQILPVLFTHLQSYIQLPKIHKDPFDRLIIAQAISENLTLISYDKIMYQYPVKAV